METIRARLTERRDAAEAKAFTKTMRDRLSRYLDYATLSLERWPLKAIDFDTVADGLTVDLPARAAIAARTTGPTPRPSICTICAGAWSSIATRWI